jgi:hypothetical protein
MPDGMRGDMIGFRHDVHVERLKALLRIGNGTLPVLQDCIIDTGAPFSVFPEKEWKRFATDITWLTADDNSPLPPWLTSVRGMTGGSVRCRPGVIDVQIIDLSCNAVQPLSIVALFAFDGGQLKNILLGLDGGALARHRFELIYKTRRAWLYEA